MKSLLVLISYLFFVGCGMESHIDPELQPFLDHYLELAPNFGRFNSLESLQFGTFDDENTRGHCEETAESVGRWNVGTSLRIAVQRPNDLSDPPLETTVYHELGHCLHELEHTDETRDIMNPLRTVDTKYWNENMDLSIKQMFR